METTKRVCAQCGKTFWGRQNAQFCSYECSYRLRRDALNGALHDEAES